MIPSRIDWEAARAYWLGLERGKRTFEDVGRRFGVSAQRVGQIAHREGWAEAAAAVDERARHHVEVRVARERAKSDLRSLALIDRAKSELERRLEAGDADVKVSDLWNLIRAERLITGEATDRVEVSEVRLVLSAFLGVAVRFVSAEQRHAFLDAARQATGGLFELPSGEEAA